MSDKKPDDDGGPAFPGHAYVSAGSSGEVRPVVWQGMSLRAWLTGQALVGLLANPEHPQEALRESGRNGGSVCDATARYCVAYADAMISELAKEKP